jgi:tetratricopeptide (TPR) repeat protein
MIGIFSPLYFFVRALTGTDKKGDGIMEKAYDQKKIGNYGQAVELYSKAIEEGNNTWVVYFYRGDCKMLAGDKQGAIADFEKAMEINPKYSAKAREALRKLKDSATK